MQFIFDDFKLDTRTQEPEKTKSERGEDDEEDDDESLADIIGSSPTFDQFTPASEAMSV